MNNSYDVIVVGGGTSGFLAAVAAARKGAKTLLIERYGFLGGSAAYGFPFLGFFSGNGEKVVGGIPEEVVMRLIEEGGSKGHVRGGSWQTKGKYEFTLTPYEPEILKYVAQEMALEADVDLILHTYLLDVIVDDDRIVGIEVLNKSGRHTIYGNIFIDASGDADLAHLTRASFQENKKMQNVTLMFVLDNVDLEKMLDDLNKNNRIKGRDNWHTRLVRGPKIDSNRDNEIVHIAGHMKLWDNKSPLTFTAVSWKKNQISLNITRTIKIDPTDAYSLVKGEISERRNVIETYKQCKKNIPGMENCSLITTAQQVGVRESRRIKGEYCLNEQDVIQCKKFIDGIARGAYPIDIHDPEGGKTKFTFLKEGGSFSIPYRCLVPKRVDGLIVTGRTISATHKALGSTRVQATCMALGEAAGNAAYLSVRNKVIPRKIDTDQLRKNLKAEGAIL